MSYVVWDEDEWERISSYKPCGSCQGDLKQCSGRCTGSIVIERRRRSPEDVARIRAEKRRLHEDAVLAEADAIRARRAACS